MPDNKSTTFPNIDFGFRRGNKDGIASAPIKEGYFNVAKDTRELFIDIDGERIHISDLIFNDKTEAEIRAISTPEPNKLYISKDTHRLLVFEPDDLKWYIFGGDHVSLADNATTATFDAAGHQIDKYYFSQHDALAEHNSLADNIDSLIKAIGDLTRFKVEVYESFEAAPNVGVTGVIYFIAANAASSTSSGSLDDDSTDVTFGSDTSDTSDVDFGDGTPETFDENDLPDENPDEDDISSGATGPEEGEAKVYNTFIWAPDPKDSSVGMYSKIGVTTLDLSDYYTKNEVDSLIEKLKNETERQFDELRNQFATSLTAINNKIDSNQTNNSSQFTTINSSITSLVNKNTSQDKDIKETREGWLYSSLTDEG